MSQPDKSQIPVRASCDGNLDKAYEDSVRTWLDEPDTEIAQSIYRTRTFPLACERIRIARETVSPLDLLFVPVGTQPYAPILGIIGNPSSCVALLETPESRSFGQQVEKSLTELGETTFLHVKVDAVDVSNIAEQMKAVYESRGLPSGAKVGADITGGRKPMTAAIAGVGSIFGWRLFYVEAEFERGRLGYGHHERVIELPNVLDVFGTRRRELALGLVKAGAYTQAATEIEYLITASVASQHDRSLLDLVRAFAALQSVDEQALISALRTESFLHSQPAVALLSALERFELPEGSIPPVTKAALYAAASSMQLEHGNIAAAAHFVSRARDLLVLPPEADDRDPAASLDDLLTDSRLQKPIEQLKSLTDELETRLAQFTGYEE